MVLHSKCHLLQGVEQSDGQVSCASLLFILKEFEVWMEFVEENPQLRWSQGLLVKEERRERDRENKMNFGCRNSNLPKSLNKHVRGMQISSNQLIRQVRKVNLAQRERLK